MDPTWRKQVHGRSCRSSDAKLEQAMPWSVQAFSFLLSKVFCLALSLIRFVLWNGRGEMRRRRIYSVASSKLALSVRKRIARPPGLAVPVDAPQSTWVRTRASLTRSRDQALSPPALQHQQRQQQYPIQQSQRR